MRVSQDDERKCRTTSIVKDMKTSETDANVEGRDEIPAVNAKLLILRRNLLPVRQTCNSIFQLGRQNINFQM